MSTICIPTVCIRALSRLSPNTENQWHPVAPEATKVGQRMTVVMCVI